MKRFGYSGGRHRSLLDMSSSKYEVGVLDFEHSGVRHRSFSSGNTSSGCPIFEHTVLVRTPVNHRMLLDFNIRSQMLVNHSVCLLIRLSFGISALGILGRLHKFFRNVDFFLPRQPPLHLGTTPQRPPDPFIVYCLSLP
jgi:hypothetical protein